MAKEYKTFNIESIKHLTKKIVDKIPINVSQLNNDLKFVAEEKIHEELEKKSDKETTYTKAETDKKIREAQLNGQVDLSSYATKEDLKNKADKNHTHNAENISGLNEKLELKADKETTYTKTEINNKIDEKNKNNANTILDNVISELEKAFSETPKPNIPCTKISINPNSLTIDKLNQNYTITAITVPEGTTDEIIWNCEADEASVKLTDNKDKTATIIAYKDTTTNVTVRCGNQSATCTITIKTVIEPEPPSNCTSIKIEPSPLNITELMHEYTLTAITTPQQVIEPITWESDAPETALDVIDNKDGTATVMAYRDITGNVTVRCGSQSATTQVIANTNIVQTTSVNFNENKLIFNNNSEEYAQNINAEIFPRGATEEMVWTVVEGDKTMVKIEPTTNGAKIIPLKVGTCKIQGQSGRYKDVCEIINVQHPETSLLESPTIKIENYKAVLEQDGHVEKFDVSYEPLTEHPQYVGNKEITGDDNVKYYLNFFKTGTSKFRVDGKIPDSGTNWKNILNKKSDSIYQFILTPFPKVNNFNFTYDVRNKDNTVIKDLFDFSIKCISTAFPALNITENPASKNTMNQADYQDTWFGTNEYFSDHFDIKINNSRMIRALGQYSEYPYRWRSTGVHELGHSLGIRDNPKHKPSLYDYGASPDKSWYIQPFDLATIEYYYKNLWNVDITLAQEEITENLKNSTKIIDEIPEDTYGIDFEFGDFTDEELINVSDVILTGNLEFSRKENIKIGEDMTLTYNVYKIIANNIEKGNLINDELKIHESIDIEIDKSATYKMYLAQYIGCPNSLVNIEQGLIRI